MRVTYDPEANAAYIYVIEKSERTAPHGRCGGSYEDGVVYDLDADGRLLGIEVLEADRRLPAGVIAMARRLPESEEASTLQAA